MVTETKTAIIPSTDESVRTMHRRAAELQRWLADAAANPQSEAGRGYARLNAQEQNRVKAFADSLAGKTSGADVSVFAPEDRVKWQTEQKEIDGILAQRGLTGVTASGAAAPLQSIWAQLSQALKPFLEMLGIRLGDNTPQAQSPQQQAAPQTTQVAAAQAAPAPVPPATPLPGLQKPISAEEKELTRSLQAGLHLLGFETDRADGAPGRQTNAARDAFVRKYGANHPDTDWAQPAQVHEAIRQEILADPSMTEKVAGIINGSRELDEQTQQRLAGLSEKAGGALDRQIVAERSKNPRLHAGYNADDINGARAYLNMRGASLPIDESYDAELLNAAHRIMGPDLDVAPMASTKTQIAPQSEITVTPTTPPSVQTAQAAMTASPMGNDPRNAAIDLWQNAKSYHLDESRRHLIPAESQHMRVEGMMKRPGYWQPVADALPGVIAEDRDVAMDAMKSYAEGQGQEFGEKLKQIRNPELRLSVAKLSREITPEQAKDTAAVRSRIESDIRSIYTNSLDRDITAAQQRLGNIGAFHRQVRDGEQNRLERYGRPVSWQDRSGPSLASAWDRKGLKPDVSAAAAPESDARLHENFTAQAAGVAPDPTAPAAPVADRTAPVFEQRPFS